MKRADVMHSTPSARLAGPFRAVAPDRCAACSRALGVLVTRPLVDGRETRPLCHVCDGRAAYYRELARWDGERRRYRRALALVAAAAAALGAAATLVAARALGAM